MANTIRKYGFANITFEDAIIPQNGTDSQAMVVPKDIQSVTFIVGALDGAPGTLKVQLMTPRKDLEGAAEVFTDAQFMASDGTFKPLAAIPASFATTIPAANFPGGVFKLVASVAQATAQRTITVVYDGFQG